MINTYIGADEEDWKSFEADAMEGRRLLRLINDGRCVNIRSIVNRAEEHFQAMMATYPKQNRRSNEFDVNDIQAMITEEYFGAIACIRDRVTLTEADRKLYELNERKEDFDPDVVAEIKELYRSLTNSPHPIIRFSAQYNLGVCQFNNQEPLAALNTFKQLEANLLNQPNLKAREDVDEVREGQDIQNSYTIANNNFAAQALLTVRSTITLVNKLIPPSPEGKDDGATMTLDENKDVNTRKPSISRANQNEDAVIPKLTRATSIRAIYESNMKSAEVSVPSVTATASLSSVSSKNRNTDQTNDSIMRQSLFVTKEIYPYDVLKGIGPFPTNVITSMRENYLSDDDFRLLFRMDRQQFASLPQWKKVLLKKQVSLF